MSLLWLAVLALLFGLGEGLHRAPSRVLGPISKPPGDKREYRGLILANNMKVLLISDPKTPKAATAIATACGSYNDPPDLPGLLHFVEHMLFLGNEKYPMENDLIRYTDEHGGMFTGHMDTGKMVLYFDVTSSYLKDTLERFAQVFISPLFAESALHREVNAIHSEHQKNIPDTSLRFDRIAGLTAKAGHPATQFSTGNSETLWTAPNNKGIDMRSTLVDFYGKHFSANIMHLAVLGVEGLDEIQKMVEDIFLEIPNKNLRVPVWAENPYGRDELQERVEIVPIGDSRSLVLMFPVDDVYQYYENSALGYLIHLINQEGPGSLFALLKSDRYIESLHAVHKSVRGHTTVRVDFTLTQEGLHHVNDIIEHFFEYMEMLRNTGPQKWYWEEINDSSALKYRYPEGITSLDFVIKLAEEMIIYPVEQILHSGLNNKSATFDPIAIKRLLGQIIPQNLRVFVTSKEFEGRTTHVEKYYGINYNRAPIAYHWINDWKNCGSNAEFHMPERNEFISTKFDLKPRDEESLRSPLIPRLLQDDKLSQVWYLQDTEFQLPKSIVRIQLFSPLSYADPLRTNLNAILERMLAESLGGYSQDGINAGLKFYMWSAEYGIGMNVNGYDHKLQIFLEKIFHKITNFSVDPQRFFTAKDTRLQFLQNERDKQPFNLANDQVRLLLRDKYWTIDELTQVMTDVTFERMQNFVKTFFSRMKLVWLFYGNLTPEESVKMAQDCVSKFVDKKTRPVFPSQLINPRIVVIPTASSYVSQIETSTHSSSYTAVLFQIGMITPRDAVKLELISNMIYVPAFDRLRTKEQLGYIVWTGVHSDDEGLTQYFRIVVQGGPQPEYVEARIDKCILHFAELLRNMNRAEFNRYKEALQSSLMAKPKTMSNRADPLFLEIRLNRLNFNLTQEKLLALESLGFRELQQFLTEKVLDERTRKRLAIHVKPTASSRTAKIPDFVNTTISQKIEDPIRWKKLARLFPSLYSHHKNWSSGESTSSFMSEFKIWFLLSFLYIFS